MKTCRCDAPYRWKRSACSASLWLCFFLLLGLPKCTAQYLGSDNGDGTFTNPVVRADYPDPDVIRVGQDYYMVSSGFHSVPSDPILHSTDLVNWELIGHAIPAYGVDARYNMEGGTRYGFGSWAPSLRYHDGTFYVLYNTPDNGAFGARATNPAGPWVMNGLGKTLYDPGLFFDEDGRVWVVSGQGVLTLTELSADLRSVIGPPTVIYEGLQKHYEEGSHVYKRNSFYYIVTATTRPDLPGNFALQVERSRTLSGPFETRVVFEDDGDWKGSALHQGALVETQEGEWWAIVFQGRFEFGREPTLQPVTWVDDWPVLGVSGQAVITYRKPRLPLFVPRHPLAGSDDFSQPQLDEKWEWNHNPDNRSWSLTERPGFLRLRTSGLAGNWKSARNTLWQRLFEHGAVSATVKLDIFRMAEGDVAGLGMFQNGTSAIAVAKGKESALETRQDDQVTASVPLSKASAVVWLRLATTPREAATSFSYSFDGKHFLPLGAAEPMSVQGPGIWIGERISIFNYATRAPGGFVDVDSFALQAEEGRDRFPAATPIRAQDYDEIKGGHVAWSDDLAVKSRPSHIGGSNDETVLFRDPGWIEFSHLDFGKGSVTFEVNASGDGAGVLEVRDATADGPLLARCVLGRPGTTRPITTSCPMKKVEGTHTAFLVVLPGAAGTSLEWFAATSKANSLQTAASESRKPE